MPESAMIITPLHILYLVGVVSVLAVMVLRRDTPLVCTLFLFLLGALGLHSFIGGIQTVFNAILYAAREFMEIIATIALVTALSKCMADLGSDRLLMEPMSKVMKTPGAHLVASGCYDVSVFSLLMALPVSCPRRRDYDSVCRPGRTLTSGRCHGHELVWPWFCPKL